MTIIQKGPTIHWNFFLALEHDLLDCSRYVEFTTKNNGTYSIEFAQLLFAACSETDVIAKEICWYIDPNKNVGNILEYQPIITGRFPAFKKEWVHIDRYGISFKPWVSWTKTVSPNWWQSYNKVKHQRNEFYSQANLGNVLKSLGGLLVITTYYYVIKYTIEHQKIPNMRDVTFELTPESELLTMQKEYYYGHLVG